jgi:uncharacterized membrane protein
MLIAGATAAAGLWSDTLHLVVGAMVIAPAFEPLVRIPLGMIIGSQDVSGRGAISAAVGYCTLLLGGAIGTLLLRMVDPGGATSLSENVWVGYWTTITAPGLLASIFAGAAGAIVVTGQRSVLTTGVMIALALVPSMALVGMGLVVGDTTMMGHAFFRWVIDVGIVLVLSALVLGVKQSMLHRARAST